MMFLFQVSLSTTIKIIDYALMNRLSGEGLPFTLVFRFSPLFRSGYHFIKLFGT